MEYPKIETLWNRDERTHKVCPGILRFAEFGNVKRWRVTEKIDGMNVRILLSPDGSVTYAGRTDNAQMPVPLLAYLTDVLPATKLINVFGNGPVIVFGEGYGGKIQKGGNYRPTPALRIFDVLAGGLWLEPANVQDVADKLEIATVPYCGEIDQIPESAAELSEIMHGGMSYVSLVEGGIARYQAEGVVARTCPLMLTRRGERIMWKLKFRDF